MVEICLSECVAVGKYQCCSHDLQSNARYGRQSVQFNNLRRQGSITASPTGCAAQKSILSLCMLSSPEDAFGPSNRPRTLYLVFF